jgi:hypothetical protein
MTRTVLGRLLAVVGVVLVAAGLVLMLAIMPAMKKLPTDTNVTRTYDGSMKTLLNPTNMTFAHDVPVQITRNFKVIATSGDVSEVKETKAVASNGQPLQQVVNTYAIDRKTMLATTSYPAAWKSAEGFFDRQGVVLSWPFDTKKKDLAGWSDDYRSTVVLKFAGEVTHPRSGLKTYLFTSESAAKPMSPLEVARMGFPTQLPKATLGGLIGASGMSPVVVQMLPSLLAKIPGDNVPLAYFYNYTGKYWVDPTTGVLIDTEKTEVRAAGLPDELIKGTPLALLPEAQRAALHVTVSELTYKATDASVADAKKSAKDDGGRIRLFGTTLPWIGIIVGIVLVLGGGAFSMKRRAA